MFFYIIQELCKAKNVTLSHVLLELGMSKANATHWKNGKIPSSRNLKKLADYFEKTTDFLLGNPSDVLRVITDQFFEQNCKESDLELYVNISAGSVQKWKDGTSVSFLDYLPEIADFFEITIEYLLGFNFIVEKEKINQIALNDDTILLYMHTYPKLRLLFTNGLTLSEKHLDELLRISAIFKANEIHSDIEKSYGSYVDYVK